MRCRFSHVFEDCLSPGELLVSMKKGLITLLPKPNKDNPHWKLVAHPSPKSCYKWLTFLFAKRLRLKRLKKLNYLTQSGFIKGRHISNKIHLVWDMMDYSDLIEEGAIILFLDFYKAFDSIEHSECFERAGTIFWHCSQRQNGFQEWFTLPYLPYSSRKNGHGHL